MLLGVAPASLPQFRHCIRGTCLFIERIDLQVQLGSENKKEGHFLYFKKEKTILPCVIFISVLPTTHPQNGFCNQPITLPPSTGHRRVAMTLGPSYSPHISARSDVPRNCICVWIFDERVPTKNSCSVRWVYYLDLEKNLRDLKFSSKVPNFSVSCQFFLRYIASSFYTRYFTQAASLDRSTGSGAVG